MTLANNYPSLVTYEAVGKTVLNEDIIMFRIGNPAGGRVLFDGGMHGPETIGGELLYLYAEWLLTSNDPLANRILKGDYTLLIPALNVDSYNRARKNANGVDLNRNFATNWEHSGSTDPSSDSYRGTGPLSEPESQRLVDVFQDYAPSFYVNLHMWDGPYYAGSVYGNKTYYSSIVSKISSLSGNRGVTPFPYYGELGGAGYAISDAARAGATSFLIELIKQVIPFSEIETTTLPRFIPVAAVLSQECESTVFFEDGFESGGFGAWNGTYATSGESAAVVDTAFYRGLHSAMFKSNGNGGTEKAYCYKNVAPSSEFCALGSFMVASSGIKENDDRFYLIMLSANENGVVKTGWRNVNGVTRWTLIMRDGTGWVTAYSDWSPSLNQWYNVALHWVSDPMNGRSELLINGQLACSFENKNTTAFGNIDQARFGLPELYYCDMTTAYFDYCKLSKTAVASFPPWDLNQDGTTNILDLVMVAKAAGSVVGSPNWDPLADLNGDKTVNILDMAAVASHLEK
jgi:sarcosine oxidase delta subunit